MFASNALIEQTERLHRFALRLTQNSSDADDLVQSTCLRALEKSDYFEDGSNLFSWTSKIMYNLFVTSYRRKVKFESQSNPEFFILNKVVPPAQHINLELKEVKSAVKKLSHDHSNILILVCIEERCYQEVADILQIPIGTVKSRLSRAREQLQKTIKNPPKHPASQILISQQLLNDNIQNR